MINKEGVYVILEVEEQLGIISIYEFVRGEIVYKTKEVWVNFVIIVEEEYAKLNVENRRCL